MEAVVRFRGELVIRRVGRRTKRAASPYSRKLNILEKSISELHKLGIGDGSTGP